MPITLRQLRQSPLIVNSIKRKILRHPAPVFAAHVVVGLPTSKTFGRVTVGTHGTPSIREACAPHACINGLRPSAFDAANGHYIPIGMHIDGGGEDSDLSTCPIQSKGELRQPAPYPYACLSPKPIRCVCLEQAPCQLWLARNYLSER